MSHVTNEAMASCTALTSLARLVERQASHPASPTEQNGPGWGRFALAETQGFEPTLPKGIKKKPRGK